MWEREPSALPKRFGLVDQHDRDVVLDRIEQFACPAYQAVLCFVELDWPLAFGTGEDIEQVLTKRHLMHLLWRPPPCGEPTGQRPSPSPAIAPHPRPSRSPAAGRQSSCVGMESAPA